ncbi:hypothetical protein [Hymenobacter siberiensis]|uniref:hypothetical protein n=1 Tax=Hymenobacter siberiensis TaxID=2848396 RepID=UPI001C1DE52C|nr:hypothetical protein [Hymenobacter siberiensis]MBU6122879.1 hypothetical protein [Hymenobacter siberiensis]
MHKAIGGFFELELPTGPHQLHPNAAESLSSGRACLVRLCQELRPALVYLPFYICDSVLAAFWSTATPYRFYGLTEALELRKLPVLEADEYLLYVNYFGLKDKYAADLQLQYGKQLLLDLTQAFYCQPSAGQYAFNSARKFFGVPDGAYLYKPNNNSEDESLLPNKDISIDHLILRHLGRQSEAYAAFSKYEERITCDLTSMSAVTQSWLSWIDYAAVAAQRRANYNLYGKLLIEYNIAEMPLQSNEVPFCYPFRCAGINRKLLFEQSIFVPCLWHEVNSRPGHEGYTFEKQLVDELLPLPIDHRYGPAEIEFVAQQVISAFHHRNNLI